MLAETLPRLRFDLRHADDPACGFPVRPQTLWLEIGFGGGEHCLAQIAENPEVGLIGCEVFENGICSLLSQLVPEREANASLPQNLRLWDRDARVLLRALPDASLARIFLLFPDPWPKLRHAKRRFVEKNNIASLARVLRPGGEWRIASDDATYQAWVDGHMAETKAFRLALRTTEHPESWPVTRYELKALRAGRTPLYWCFEREA